MSIQNLRGKFIVVEGCDGCGKSTQALRIHKLLEEKGIDHEFAREPGGTKAGEGIRRVLLDRNITDMTSRCEMMLFMASRAQLVETRIKPALAAGKTVLLDRYIPSTVAYQGAGRHVQYDDILAAAGAATGFLAPDATLVYTVTAETAAKRVSPLLDRMEAAGEAFHNRVRGAYEQMCVVGHPWYLIDANGSEEDTWGMTQSKLMAFAHACDTAMVKNVGPRQHWVRTWLGVER